MKRKNVAYLTALLVITSALMFSGSLNLEKDTSISTSESTIIIQKFIDSNQHGLVDLDDERLAGWGFIITDPNGNTTTYVTNVTGEIRIEVPEGKYIIVEKPPPEWTSITPTTRVVNVQKGKTIVVVFTSSLPAIPTPTPSPDNWIWLALVPGIISTIIVCLALVYKTFVLRISSLSNTLEELKERVSEFETRKSTKNITEDFHDRLSKIEVIMKEVKERPKLSSPEYGLLEYQINKLVETRENQQDRLERVIEKNINSIRSEYNILLAMMSTLFTVAIAILLFFLSEHI